MRTETLLLIVVATFIGVLIGFYCQSTVGKFLKREGFTPAQRLGEAGRYACSSNYLLSSDKQPKCGDNSITLPLFINSERGDSPMSYLLPSNGVSKEVAEAPVADITQAPPVIGGTQITNDVPADASVSLNVSNEELVKAGGNTTKMVDFYAGKDVPDTSALPAVVQTGVVSDAEIKKEGFCGGNTRSCPSICSGENSICNAFHVNNNLQKGGISQNEGFVVSARFK